MEKTVIELFAGVGGFRVGLNNINSIDGNGHAIEKGNFRFVWANQWEPSTKTQHAFDCYNLRFPEDFNSNSDISKVDKKQIPNHTLLCGGFPCQDYSVAHSLSKEKGIEGKKGVLWWQIRDILVAKKTPFVFLENVDRLTKSPAKQRGRDFGIMLKCLDELGYAVEWRIINAADYGFPQRRRRTYIFAYRKGTNFYKSITKYSVDSIILSDGIFAKAFPIVDKELQLKESNLKEFNDLVEFSDNYKFSFENSGYMHEECADLVRRGEAFYFDSKGKIKDKFPKENRNNNHVCHVRPHARVVLDHYILPVADKQTGITSYTKQSFWFNKDFIEKIIK